MLKFADLNIDFKSFENSLNSYMKLFPGSYTPLLIMYLANKGLLKLVYEFEKDDPRILVSVEKNKMHDFFGDNIVRNLIQDPEVWEFKGTLEETINLMNKSILKDRDVYVMLPFIHLLPRILSGSPMALIADVSTDDQIVELINIITESDHAFDNPAALLFFSVMLMKKYEPIIEDEKDKWIIADFESTLESIMSYSGNSWMQPWALTRIILSQYKGGSVYNPFAGVASYHTAMCYGLRNESQFYQYDEPEGGSNSLGDNYWGEEINKLTWAIGKLRLMFYGMDSANYIHGDSTKGYDGCVNNILCTPPFNFQITNESGNKELADHFVLRRGIEMLTDGGMMAIVVPVSFLSRRDTFDIRKDLISKHLLTHVVYLPEDIFSFTKISTAILFVHKNAENKKLKFIDATSRRVNIYGLNVAAISNLIEHDSYPAHEWSFTFGENNTCDELTPAVFNTCISFEDYRSIATNDYDLSPSFYFFNYIDIPEGFKLARFKDLIIAKSPANISGEVEGKVLSSSNLVKDYQMPYVDIDSLGSKVVNSNYKLLERKTLLVSSMNELKPSIFVPSDVNVYVSPNVLAFYLNEKKINAEYLVGELSKDYVKEQLRLRVMGSTIQRMKRDDILSFKILVPDSNNFLKKEKEIANERKKDFLNKMGVELAELKDKHYDEYVKMLRQRKHRIQQVMNEFAPAFSLLNQCRENHGGVLQNDDIVATRTGETVDGYFKKLQAIINKVEDLVTNLVDKEQWGNPSIVNIDSHVDNIPQNHLSDKFDIQTFHNYDVYIEEYGETADLNNDRFVNINIDDLTIIFDNIIANASKWGFTDSVRRDYRIRINVSDTAIDGKSAVRICISNNGEPIHPSVDRKRFFEWGYGTGTGIGTAQLKDIVEHYEGIIKLNEYPNDSAGFCTEYEIILPVIEYE